MRKLLLAIIGLLITSTCFASEQVYVLGKDDKVSTPLSVGSTVTTGQKTNISSSTALVLGDQSISELTIYAYSTNKDYIYVGTSGVVKANGFGLASGNSLTLNVDNLSDIYIISGNGAGQATNTITYIGTIR